MIKPRGSLSRLCPLVPRWLQEWAVGCSANAPTTDEAMGIIRLLNLDATLGRLLRDPEVAGKLAREDRRLIKHDSTTAQRWLTHFIASACHANLSANRRSLMSGSEEAAELRSIAAASEKLAKKIRSYSTLFGAADTLPYLQHRLSNPQTSQVADRFGVRGYKFELGTDPRLPTLLCCFAADLEDQVERAKVAPRGDRQRKMAGKYAARNFEIDALIGASKKNLGKVRYALIAAIVTTTTGTPVDESTVRKRAN